MSDTLEPTSRPMSKRATGLGLAMICAASLFIIVAIGALKGGSVGAQENKQSMIVVYAVDVEAAANDEVLRAKILQIAINEREGELDANCVSVTVGRLSPKGIPMKYFVILRTRK